MQIAVNHGEGQHIQYLHDPEQQALELLKIDAFYQMDVVVCTLLTKISICLFILRIKNDKPLRWTFAISMTFMTLATLAVIIMECLACIPMRKLWEPETPGKCLPQIKVYTVAYVHSGLTILTDGALTLSPILILWKVQMKRERKILVSFLMSLGLVATLTNALRNYYQKGLTTPDFPCKNIPKTFCAMRPLTNSSVVDDMHTVLMLSILETGSGIIAACVPASSPIIRLFRRRRPTYTEDSYPMTRKIKSSTDDSNTWESSRHYDELSG